jgi:hypothetical protein
VKEFTITGEYKPAPWLMARLEFRNDWSDKPFFEKEGGASAKTQPTILFGLVAFLGPKK